MPRPTIKTRQSPSSVVGACYGYSTLWAKGILNISIDNEQPDNTITLPLNAAILYVQWLTQFSPVWAQRLPNFYMDWEEDVFLKDAKDKLQNIGDAVVIGYSGMIGGHALALKKTGDSKYEYFDCNEGVYELDDTDLKNFFSDYLHPIYKKVFYGLTLEYLPADKNFAPDSIKNTIAAVWTFGCKIITAPIIGIGRYIKSLVELVSSSSYVNLKTETVIPHESTSLIITSLHENETRNQKTVAPSCSLQSPHVKKKESSFLEDISENFFSLFASSNNKTAANAHCVNTTSLKTRQIL